jgi:cobaltochelatase CobS
VTGLYHGTNPINQGQMDRWNLVVNLDHPKEEQELTIVLGNVTEMEQSEERKALVKQMITLANMTRTAFSHGDLSSLMSPRTVINWAENYLIFNDREMGFRYAYMNKCDDAEKPLIAEFYQRVFDRELPELTSVA